MTNKFIVGNEQGLPIYSNGHLKGLETAANGKENSKRIPWYNPFYGIGPVIQGLPFYSNSRLKGLERASNDTNNSKRIPWYNPFYGIGPVIIQNSTHGNNNFEYIIHILHNMNIIHTGCN